MFQVEKHLLAEPSIVPPLAITGADLETTRVWNDVSTQQRMSLMISSIFIKYEKLQSIITTQLDSLKTL